MLRSETKSTCPYCGVGCGVLIETEGAQIVGVRGDPDHPANYGRLCSKGSTLHLTASAAVNRQTRLAEPLRRSHRGGVLEPLSWDAALSFASERFAQIIEEHGPDAVGFYISGQLLTEDYYIFNKLAKGLIGTNNIDTNSRLCMSSAVAGYKQSLGADAPPNCYDDVNHADCLFITGSNTAWAHPVFFRRIEDAKRARPQMRIVVVDPRRTETAQVADLHLQIQPGSDIALYQGMLHVMLWEGWIDHAYIAAHTQGFDALKAQVRDATPAKIAQICGIREADLLTATRWFAGMVDDHGKSNAARKTTLSLYCQGLNQSSHGTANNASLINLHLATGQIGKPGAGPFSLTGQPNAMGGREVGGLANLMSAHRDMANPAHRAEIEALWGLDKLGRQLPSIPGKTAVEMFQAAADGRIKALWIACTNPAQSMPDLATVQRALERAELVVLQEAFATTATAAYADLLLPASTWGEKTGTVTNSERRISRVRPALEPWAQARHDWRIALDFARLLERRLRPHDASIFAYADDDSAAEQIWNEHRESTRGRDLDITGLSWSMLDEQGPQQWPLREGETHGKARLYEDGVFPTADGRARFVTAEAKLVAEPREARYPFSLTTARLRDQWHGMSRTGSLGRLFGHAAEPSIAMYGGDMARRQISDGDLVHVTSRRGSIILPAFASEEIAPSQCAIAMHWGPEFLGGRSGDGTANFGVNTLTTSAYCPSSKQPELKHAAVKILKAEMPWQVLALAWMREAEVLAARTALKPLMATFDYVACVPFASNTPLERAADQRHGLMFRAALAQAPDDVIQDDRLNALEAALGISTANSLRYADRRAGQRRAAKLVRNAAGEVKLEAVLLAGDTRASQWISTLLKDELDAHSYGRLILLPSAKPPLEVKASSPQVCTCFNVTRAQIEERLASCTGSPAERLAQLQSALRCGTNCGSCVPQLKAMIAPASMMK